MLDFLTFFQAKFDNFFNLFGSVGIFKEFFEFGYELAGVLTLVRVEPLDELSEGFLNICLSFKRERIDEGLVLHLSL